MRQLRQQRWPPSSTSSSNSPSNSSYCKTRPSLYRAACITIILSSFLSLPNTAAVNCQSRVNRMMLICIHASCGPARACAVACTEEFKGSACSVICARCPCMHLPGLLLWPDFGGLLKRWTIFLFCLSSALLFLLCLLPVGFVCFFSLLFILWARVQAHHRLRWVL